MAKLIWTATEQEVKVGDEFDFEGQTHIVEFFRPPHSPASEGKINIRLPNDRPGFSCQYYVSVIGAKWIEREDGRDD